MPPEGALSRARAGTSEYYLPHHGVLRVGESSSKIRVVFNGSIKTSSGRSLNDILYTGAKLQRDISDILLRVRIHCYIFMTDIAKMFRQIRVHRDDWSLQRILWLDNDGTEVAYNLSTVTYGTRSAPFVAMRVLRQLVADEGDRNPLAVDPLTRGRYVDDICGGGDSVGELMRVAGQVRVLCAAGCFPLAKWQSNSTEFLSEFGPDCYDSDQPSRRYHSADSKILGLHWRSDSDTFDFTSFRDPIGRITKRVILWEVAQLFDPLGFLTPVVTRAKVLLQSLWIDRLGWDDDVSPQIARQWAEFRDDLSRLLAISIPRWFGASGHSAVEIHGFSDASQTAMGAVVFLRVASGSDVRVYFVCAKSKVAPLKRLTIPRLELSAAVLLARLTRWVRGQLDLQSVPVVLWTDSSVTLAWVNSHPSR